MKSLLFILREHAHNFRRIFKMVAYNIITLNRETYLGILWSILSPAIQIGVYYMVFGLGIKHGNPVDGHPFFIWMITGLIPWFYIIQSITGGAMSLSSNSGMITRIKFPVSIIPTYTVLTKLVTHLIMVVLLLLILAFNGYKATVYFFQLPYYMLANTLFLISLSFVTSSLVMVVRDIGKVISSGMRLIFYMTPILWVPENLPSWLQSLIANNPLLYIISGFRDSLLYNRWFFEGANLKMTGYYWAVVFILLLFGSFLQCKLRRKFMDPV